MPEMSTEQVDVRVAIAALGGKIDALTSEMRSGDRASDSGVRLLAETVKNIDARQGEQRADLKLALDRFDARTDAVKEYAGTATSAVRVDLERQLREHADADAPHPKTLGDRLDRVESKVAQARAALAVFIALPAVAGTISYLAGYKP